MITTQEMMINNTNVIWSTKTTDQSTSLLSSAYENTIANTNHGFDNQQKITTTAGSFLGKATLSSTSDLITPVIDTKRLSVIAVENKINNLTSNETALPSGGDALARYITRRVTLTDGFDATDLKVYLTVHKPAGTNVTVYYKVKSQYDADGFDEKLWVALGQTSQANTVALGDEEFIEYEYDPTGNNVNYTSGGATYTTFKTFAIKIVMTSTTTAKVPKISDLRAIALA